VKISARVSNSKGYHSALVRTDRQEQQLSIHAKAEGLGSSVNGGELLFLALATCYCNDLYREAAKREMSVAGVEVEVSGDFGGEGEPARNVRYRVNVTSESSPAQIADLVRYTDAIAEIHKTLRLGVDVKLDGFDLRRPSVPLATEEGQSS
jgi:uncharacterized OsmC-like protein